MNDFKDTNPRSDEEHGLEEVRLRQQAIGVKLRHLFDEVVNEPIPDEFLEILRKADEKTQSKEGQ
ncbi:anti-sigma T factor NepR [Brevundimonas faecalis]|uniref:Anti-sigma factor NepR domain-containing protein n=1 Tax=Brevundimonas faecalis TaxID=947378 RepID=A0ABV2R6U1_9CAUL